MTFDPTTFSYNSAFPNPNDYPGDDVDTMSTNAISIQNIIDQDHGDFNGSSAGWHRKVTFLNNYIVDLSTPPTALQSVAYTIPGTASSNPQYVFTNASGNLPVSALRAFGTFIATGNPPAIQNGFNISTIVNVGSTYVITLSPNITTGNSAVVLLTCSSNSVIMGYTFAANVLTISGTVFNSGLNVNFAVIQM